MSDCSHKEHKERKEGRCALVAASGRAVAPRPPQGDLSHAEAQRGRERRDLPKVWEVRRIKSLMRPHKKLVGKRSSEYDLLSLTLRGVVKRDMENPEGKFPSSFDTYQEVNEGDFVFCMFDNEETPRAVGLSSLHGMITGAYDVMSLVDNGVNKDFLNYYFLWVDDGKRLKPLYKGLRKTVPLDSFLASKISLPPLPEQEAIVAYLDAETVRIDKAIVAEEKMIALLQERREIVINEAVGECCQCENVANTQSQYPIGIGNNGTGNTSTMATFSSLPKGWEVRRLKSELLANDGGVWGDDPRGNKRDTIVLRSTEQNVDGTLSVLEPAIRNLSEFERSKAWLQEGDLIVTKSSGSQEHIGKTSIIDKTIADKGCCYSNFLQRLRVKGNPKYFWYLLNGVITKRQLERMATTTTGLKNLTGKILSNLEFPLPPLPEQEAIVERLDRETGKIDRAIEVKRRQIELLRERRQIVIDEVVTGKVKVA